MAKVNFDLNSSERSTGSRVSGCLAAELSGVPDGCGVAEADWAEAEKLENTKTRIRILTLAKSVTTTFFFVLRRTIEDALSTPRLPLIPG